jgi:alkyldihydroxyacetonephosphate synthase
MPYAREFLTPAGLINDTFETAITWDRFESFHDKVKAATERAILAATGVRGEVTCRFTHVYPDGPAPYFSFHALGRHGALLEQWQAIKNAASDALIEAGGIITPLAVIIGLGTTASARGFSRPRFGQQKESSIRKACSTREC